METVVTARCATSAFADAEILSPWIVRCVCSMHVVADFRNALDWELEPNT